MQEEIEMKLTQIRNATNRLEYAGKTFLIDPWLSPKHTLSFAGIPGMPYHTLDPVQEQLMMPFFDLPFSREAILKDVDYYIVTHLHPDHIDISMDDGTVGAPLHKDVPVICQNEEDASVLRRSGFHKVIVLPREGMLFDDTKLTKVPALHGTIHPAGQAMGVVFESASEKTFYLSGDTIWYESVRETIHTFKPELIALNCCAAETRENGRLIMGAEDVWSVSLAAPQARLYLTHLDNVSHASLTRHSLTGRLMHYGVMNYDMPADGESRVY